VFQKGGVTPRPVAMRGEVVRFGVRFCEVLDLDLEGEEEEELLVVRLRVDVASSF